MKFNVLVIMLLVGTLLSSCASKKEILYLQDASKFDNSELSYGTTKIQPNDILRITVGALIEETAIPFNRSAGGQGGGGGIELIQLEGYLVTNENSISFPQLGSISTKDKTVLELEEYIKQMLESKGLLKAPTVNVRLLNAKVTILGEINSPGVYTFTEQNITLLQAIGYAGDLTINGKREDIKIIRELDGNRQIGTVDLTSGDFLNSDFYHVKPNDVIVVNPNDPRVKSAGFIGNVGTLLSVVSILFTTIVLITR
ncbi:polysaccharide export protein [Subsaximicrobium wynnwilliamsii]|uniref:Polysaccharide export protein n=1 Tax=Subsaximicrobium wynnwilliamsii TaxID=291179 RepID=A0A5C6ZG63_9FLAO|nr:polysaccharide biosynthesis/export family protein [Subsaximicrobium wynnwilliamsii]TXD83385.1 polysaccharide export protein [Subsaximicrobium wynnwilliamsii]TXD89078.1 polysaccharide export protein [Subsaximicrobium wynnwilliamsii]TXE03409.1 polysaccharide export protein [Subsaximicrobium wynnwilliamsii]